MSLRTDVFEVPRLLERFAEANFSLAEKMVRQRKLGTGPIFLVGEEALNGAALMATYAFESLLGRPVLARSSSVFSEYTIRGVEPNHCVLLISRLGQSEELLRAARLAKARGATVWAVTANTDNPLAQLANVAIPVLSEAGSTNHPAWVIGASWAMIALPMIASQVLTRLSTDEKRLQEEFFDLPGRMELVLTRSQDGARSLGKELWKARSWVVSGGGFYHAVAWQAAQEFKAQGMSAQPCDLADHSRLCSKQAADSQGILLISGSACALKARVHEVARQVRLEGKALFAVTDSNDSGLSGRCRLALLLPTVQEPSGAILALAAIEEVVALTEKMP